jgi:N-acetylglucosaminyl-diphospho-decaprenol L-rhamnosyltransferase
MNNGPTVDVVVVNYNTRDLLLACISSLIQAQQRGELDAIVVVDCSSSDGSESAVRLSYPQLPILSVPNRGFGAGANAGIAATSSRYVLILNADTTVPSGTVAELAHYLDEHGWVAVVGPRMRYPDGQIQPTRRRFPRRLTPLFESTIIQEWWPKNPWTRHYYVNDVSGDIPQEIDWVVGAAMLVRREAIAQVGEFDETFRMYSEEVEWCWRFRLHGWRVAFLPDVEVMHHEGASTQQDIPSRQRDFDASRVLLIERMYGSRQAAFTRWALLTGYLLHIAREGLKWMLGHRRDLRRQRIAFYRRAIRDGLRADRGSNG